MSIFLRPGQIKVRDDTGEFTSINVMAETSADEIINDIEAAGREVIESIPEDYTELTEEVSELNERIDNINPGLSDEAKTALLACFAHVAWADEYGQDYYDALAEALDADAPIIPLYSLASPTIFDGTNDIDTEVVLEWGKTYTILLEYTPDTIDSSIRGAICMINPNDTNQYSAIQIGRHWSTKNPTVWGFCLTQPGDAGAQNAAVGAFARHAIVIDATGAVVSGNTVLTHYYKNLSNDNWSGDYEGTGKTREQFESYGSMTIASSIHPNIFNFKGMVSEAKIYDVKLSETELRDFLSHGAKRPVDRDLVYALPEPTTFDRSNYIDTGLVLSAGGVWTILLEYEPTEVSSDTLISGDYQIDYVLSNVKDTSTTTYQAIQLCRAYIGNTYKPVVFGAGMGWQSTVSNAGVGDIMRHAIVIDTREGAATNGKYLVKHWFKNRTKTINNSYTKEMDAIYEGASFVLGGTRTLNNKTKNFKGRVTTCRILSRELDETAINMFTTYGRW